MTAKNTQTGPKYTHYRSKHDGQVHPALRFPAGYEDAHPEDYEPIEGGYDPAKGDKIADERRLQAEADSRIDRSGYVAPVMANTPIASNEEPLPPTSIVYANPGLAVPVPGGSDALPGRSDGGQVVIGGADRSQVRVSGEPPAPVEGVVNPADVAQVQIDANAEAAAALKDSANAQATDTDEGEERVTVASLKEQLDEKGIEYTSSDRKADLQAKLDKANKA